MDAAVKEERPVRKPADKVVAPVLLDNPVPSHAGIIPKRGYCINTTVSMSSDPFTLPVPLVYTHNPLSIENSIEPPMRR